MTVKKVIGKLHLWLGLISGLLVFIIAITGCIYTFQEEIQNLTQPYRFVEAQEKPFLPPSKIREVADAANPGRHVHGILYQGQGRAANAIYYSYEDHYYDFVYVNPYTGEVLEVVDVYDTFFRFILDGHFYLWLPPEIGQPVVASATLVFVVMLISGIVLWWPKNRNGAKQRFSIKWNVRWRRKNYDLHNVLGFYVSWIAIILALTGLVWGFEWFRDTVYFSVGGEKSLVYQEPPSDISSREAAEKIVPEDDGTALQNPVDVLWEQMKRKYPHSESIEMHFPEGQESPIHVALNPDATTYWQIDYLYFDQYTMEELQVDHIYDRFQDATTADKLMRMNYDIHTGAIFGLAGKILAFFASLLCASLPVTGFLIWWGRKKKGKNNKEAGLSAKNRQPKARPGKSKAKQPVALD